MSVSRTTKAVSSSNMNSLKSIVPCLIQDILEEETSREVHMSQKEIRTILKERYNVSIERQALGRHINTLLGEEEFKIFGNGAAGYYYNKDYKWSDFSEEYYSNDEPEANGYKCNDRKSLICCFVRAILMDYHYPVTQEKLQKELDRYPYGITIDRKSLSRTLATLMEVYPEIRQCSDGYYYNRYSLAA